LNNDGALDGLELYHSVLHGLYEQLDALAGLSPPEKEKRTAQIMYRLVRKFNGVLVHWQFPIRIS
jgi:hypothetical protein